MDVIGKIVFGFNLHRFSIPLTKLGTIGRSKPYFFIAGFQKCGTTSLYEELISNPWFIRPYNKEDNRLALNPNRSLEFKYGFPYSILNKRSACASHLFTYLPEGIDSINKYYPKAKIIVIMRNPVDRALSHFDMDQRFGWIPESISAENWLRFELDMLNEARVDFESIESVYRAFSIYQWRFGTPVARGIYYPYVKRLSDLKCDFLPVFLEELDNCYESEMIRIYDFLEVPTKYRFLANRLKKENGARRKSDISSELRNGLSEFYKVPNSMLSQHLNKALEW